MLRVIAILAAFTLGFGALFGPIERALVYPFDSTRVSPATAGEPRLKESIKTTGTDTGAETLILWVAPPKRGKPVILYFHGNAGNLANRTARFRHFLDRGYGVVAPAYRGSSGSSGTPSEPALRADALAAYHQIPQRRTTGTQIIIYGESLGTGVAIALNADLESIGITPTAIILEAPYTSIPDVARAKYPALGPIIGKMKNRWQSLQSANKITAPLLILHGDSDALIPQHHGRAIFAAAQSADKNFISVRGAGHNNIWRTSTHAAMWGFIDTYAAK